MSEWFEDDSFWIENYPYMFDQARFEKAVEQIDSLLSLVDVRGKAVLDLCCGPGRHALEFARRGYQVTGVDRTAFLLDKAREKARQLDLSVEWVQEDMRGFVRPETYDLALSMFTSFGYFEDRTEDERVLRHVYDSLKPGGTFVIEVAGKEWVAGNFKSTTSDVEADGTLIVQRREVFDDWTRLRNEWLFIRDSHVKSFKFQHTIYSGQELKDRLLLAGFDSVALFGDLDGGEYGPNAHRLFAVGHKSAGNPSLP